MRKGSMRGNFSKTLSMNRVSKEPFSDFEISKTKRVPHNLQSIDDLKTFRKRNRY